MKHIERKFDDLADYLDYTSNKPESSLGRSSTKRDNGRNFNETTSLPAALKLARKGWKPDGDVDSMIRALVDSVRETTDRVAVKRWGVSGSKVHMGRFVQGDPNNMRQRVRRSGTTQAQKIVLVLDANATSGVKSATYLRRAVAIMVVAEVLAGMGIALEVWSGTAARSPYSSADRWQELVKIKPANEPTDVDTFAFVLGHPDWFRRIGFSAREQETDVVRRHFGFHSAGGYGPCIDIDATEVRPTVLIPRLQGFDNAQEFGVKWVLDILRKCGLQIEETED